MPNKDTNRQLTKSQQRANKQLTTKEEGKKDKNIKKTTYPDWLDIVLWNEFKKHRSQAATPALTPHAEKLNITSLKNLIDSGYDQSDIINQSIERGWKGFFPIKNATPNKPERPKQESIKDLCK